MKRKLIIITAIIIVSIILIVSAAFKFETKPKYELSKIEKRTIIETVEASGTVNPVQTVSIGSQVSGMIKDIYVDFNSRVKKGQLLAQIDPSLFQAQVDKARGDLGAARANSQKVKSMLIYDEANYKRYKELYKKRYVSKSDLDLAYATYQSDLAQLASTNALISQANATLQNNLTNLRYTRIISPVDGVVVSRDVDVGQTVAASFQTPTLFSVAQDLTKMQIEVSVSEADIGKVKEGQEAEYTLDGYPNETFKGKVSQVRLASTTVSNVVTYTVVVSVSNENDILKPGMTANVSIITDKKENALCVDNSAMRFTPKEITGGKKFDKQGIWVLRKNKPVRINIKTGVADSDFTEIISEELKQDEEVIIGSLDKKQTTNNMKPPRMF
ncbi:MAG: efflux RND transporter periplasmic adaptor subunit [Candidatus Gastranaerophilales bacterium]|nr:efflux RND transporter periplasmic adaptor subunit [Candidatus Gastranaerophilales bacterium]